MASRMGMDYASDDEPERASDLAEGAAHWSFER
jgi:hypothetical protein